MQQHLALTLITPQHSNALDQIAEICAQYNCTIIESRLSAAGQNQIMMMYISGTWNNIAKAENPLLTLGSHEGMRLYLTRTEMQLSQAGFLPYLVHITSPSNPQTLNQVAGFFSGNGIKISELSINQYSANKTQTQMQTIAMTVLLPADTHLADLRESFILFCDEYNLDAIFEPDRM